MSVYAPLVFFFFVVFFLFLICNELIGSCWSLLLMKMVELMIFFVYTIIVQVYVLFVWARVTKIQYLCTIWILLAFFFLFFFYAFIEMKCIFGLVFTPYWCLSIWVFDMKGRGHDALLGVVPSVLNS